MEKIIFSLTSSKQLAKDIANVAGIPLGESKVFRFADGEIMARCDSKVQVRFAMLFNQQLAHLPTQFLKS